MDGCCFILTDPRKGVLKFLEMGFYLVTKYITLFCQFSSMMLFSHTTYECYAQSAFSHSMVSYSSV